MRRYSPLFLVVIFLCSRLAVGAPGAYSTICVRGETFSRTILWQDSGGDAVDLTSYSAELVIVNFGPKLFDNDTRGLRTTVKTLTESSGLTLGGTAGTILWEMTAVQTAIFPLGHLLYSIKLTSGVGVVTYLLQGAVNVEDVATE